MPVIKNNLKNKISAIFLAAAFVFLAPAFTLAAESGVPWQVESFGVFQTPAGWQAVKLEEVLDRLDKMFQELPAANPKAGDPATPDQGKLRADFTGGKNLLEKILKEQKINIYQIVLDSNDTCYAAGLALFKEDNPMPENEAFYFGKKATKKNRQDFAAILMALQNEAINAARTWSDSNPASDMSFKVLPAGQVEQLSVKKAPAYAIGSRFIVSAFGVTGPYYVKTYVFNLDGRRAYAILWSPDSERAFWNKTFRPVIASLE